MSRPPPSRREAGLFLAAGLVAGAVSAIGALWLLRLLWWGLSYWLR